MKAVLTKIYLLCATKQEWYIFGGWRRKKKTVEIQKLKSENPIFLLAFHAQLKEEIKLLVW